MFGDRKGPLGKGEKTGRGLGYCNAYDVAGYMNGTGGFGGAQFGRSFNCRRGLGMGRRFGAGMGFKGIRSLDNDYPNDIEFLKKKKQFLEKDLEAVREKLEKLEK